MRGQEISLKQTGCSLVKVDRHEIHRNKKRRNNRGGYLKRKRKEKERKTNTMIKQKKHQFLPGCRSMRDGLTAGTGSHEA